MSVSDLLGINNYLLNVGSVAQLSLPVANITVTASGAISSVVNMELFKLSNTTFHLHIPFLNVVANATATINFPSGTIPTYAYNHTNAIISSCIVYNLAALSSKVGVLPTYSYGSLTIGTNGSITIYTGISTGNFTATSMVGWNDIDLIYSVS
jgi:hypothetical protein